MATIIQIRRDYAESWTIADPVLAEGELGIELDHVTPGNGRFKVGDGTHQWSQLSYGGLGGGTWRTGEGVPAVELGFTADLYLNTANGDVYEKGALVWSKIGCLMGPGGEKGDKGNTGDKGDRGETGERGLQGFDGADGDDGHSPVLTWVGDKIAVDGVADGPALTGPQGEQGLQGEGADIDSIGDIADVDLVTPAPTKNDCLKFNGTKWVSAVYNYNFAFSVATFADDQADTQLIGAGVWKAAGAIAFTATYLNGPPLTAAVSCTSWASPLNLTTPFAAVVSAEDTAYPATKGSAITFSFSAANGETGTGSAVVTFYNNICWGISTTASGYVSADVVGLSGSAISPTQSRSVAINGTAGNYLIFAFPASYTSIHATGFLFNGVSCPFQSPETVSVTNAAGFTENYKVYRSTNAALGNSTLVASTASNLIDPIYYGLSTKTGTFLEADVEGLATSVISNTKGRTISVTAGANDYIVYALPVRLGTVVFTVGGFEGGFEAPETVSITNVNGYTENYYVYRSANKNLGATTVVVS